MRSQSAKITRSKTDAQKSEIAAKFVLHENHELVGPNLPFYYCRINANKILDGLFVGNQDAAHDLEFLMSIKCKYVLNCAGSSVPNLFSRFGVRYLTQRWFDSKSCIIFDSQGKSIRKIHRFIENALNRGHSVLVHSIYGDSRACLAIAAYLMIKFNWSVKKSLEFVAYKRPETNPKPHFIKQLMKAAKYLRITEPPNTTIDDRWCIPIHETTEEAVVTNTFLNSHSIRFDEEEVSSPITKLMASTESHNQNRRRLQWNPQLAHIADNNNLNQHGVNESKKDEEKPVQSILRVRLRPSTPTVTPSNKSVQSTNRVKPDANNKRNDSPDIIQLDASSNDSDSNKNANNNTLSNDGNTDNIGNDAENKKSVTRNLGPIKLAGQQSNDYLDSTLSYLSDTLSSMNVERNSKKKSSLHHNANGNNNSNNLNGNSNNSNGNSNSSLWSSSRPRTKRNSWSMNDDNTSSNRSINNLVINSGSKKSQISGLRVIGRSNDPIKVSNNTRFSSSGFGDHRSNRPIKASRLSSKKKAISRAVRKGAAPLYSKPTSRRSSLQRTSNMRDNGLMNDFGARNSTFGSRRLMRTASEERLSAVKSHHFKSRIGASNAASGTKTTPNRPRSAPKGKNGKKTSSTASRLRSNSAKPPKSNSSGKATQFRRVGW